MKISRHIRIKGRHIHPLPNEHCVSFHYGNSRIVPKVIKNQPPVLLAILFLFTVATTDSFAKCSATDLWSGDDKKLHLLAGIGIASIVTTYANDPMTGFYAATTVGVAKEAYDAAGNGTCSLPDLLITVAGAAVGAYATHIFISHTRGQTTVSYSLSY